MIVLSHLLDVFWATYVGPKGPQATIGYTVLTYVLLWESYALLGSECWHGSF